VDRGAGGHGDVADRRRLQFGWQQYEHGRLGREYGKLEHGRVRDQDLCRRGREKGHHPGRGEAPGAAVPLQHLRRDPARGLRPDRYYHHVQPAAELGGAVLPVDRRPGGPYEAPGAWNIEAVVSSGVDLQFAPSGDSADLSKLTSAGIPTLVLPDFASLDGLSAAVGFEGRALGGTAPQRAQAYQQYLAGKLAMITAVTSRLPAAKRPSVLAVDSDAAGSVHVLGAGTIMNQWIGIADGINAARSIAGAAPTEVSVEQIQKWNPDVIVAGLPADAKAMMADPRLKGVKAVINHRVLTNPAGTIIWMYYGTEEALNIQWAARELHPDLFPDLDIPAVTKAFYQQFFGYQLSQAQVNSILRPTS
jgi:ABC-type Fe3+-hydroxamate transport system substrate-binding protein